ncbi:MAG: hypothetical protein KJN84_13125 [Bacteroidia bacterium]|nr:hypothetical protein [Bacteroidia bacterium]
MKYLEEIKKLLDEEHSKSQKNKILEYVGDDPEKMKALMSFFLDRKWHWRYNQRAAWPVGYLGRKFPKLINPYFDSMISMMDNPSHDAVLRNILRILEDIVIPESYEGMIYDRCFLFLNDPNFSIAIRVFSMTVLFKISEKYPDLQEELEASIRMHMPYGSAGFKSRGRKYLKAINKMKKDRTS